VPVARPPCAGKAPGAERTQDVYIPPQNCPWTRPATHPDGAWIQLFICNADANANATMKLERPSSCSAWWGPIGAGPPRDGATLSCLILLFANFLTSALASERGFHTFLLTGLEVKGVALDLLDNVFLLHFALETAQSVLEGFTLL